MCPKSNNITQFALDLKSAYEGEHTIFGLLSLANLAQDDVLQFYPHMKIYYILYTYDRTEFDINLLVYFNVIIHILFRYFGNNCFAFLGCPPSMKNLYYAVSLFPEQN
jgi:hypothetical protein